MKLKSAPVLSRVCEKSPARSSAVGTRMRIGLPPLIACGRRPVLVRVEEEQLVVAAGLADRAAERVAEVLVLGFGFGVAVLARSTQLFAFQSELLWMS